MDNLRAVLNIVLSKIPPVEILTDKIRYDDITEETFVKLAGYYVTNYTNDELKNLFYYVQNEYSEQTDYLKGYLDKESMRYEKFNVFNIILLFAARVLMEQDALPVCRYDNLLRWRMTSHRLDEDVFTTAYLAYRDIHYYKIDRDFSWRTIISHNNQYLKQILAKGMADNHFHLKGSAPQFPLSWLYMMNHVSSTKIRKVLEQYSDKRLSVVYFTGENEEHLYISYLKAALIRCFLYAKLTGKQFVLKDIPCQEYNNSIAVEKQTEKRVIELLQSKDEILIYRSQIQNNISNYRYTMEKNPVGRLDYAGNADYFHNKEKADTDGILSGERWFMYSMFRLIYSKDQNFKDHYNLFYAYLVVKETIRSEMVQTNSNIGYDNFEQYQDRKEDFVENTEYEKYYIRMAVKGTLMNQPIRYLEVRISPKMSAKENRATIQKHDARIRSSSLQDKYFYVFHFVKEKESRAFLESNILCRHYKKRKSLQTQAFGIAELREKYPKEARRVRGIDACAREVGCRPEVFAQTFRYLSNHIVYLSDRNTHYSEEEYSFMDEYEKDYVRKQAKAIEAVPQLRMTYHIGEDYLDIADGLRALDEAVRFLKLNCGSRLGHALVLGVDVDEYYALKKNRILISQQDYLDNLVWIYYKIKKFGLNGYDDLQIFIEQEYNKYIRRIYGNYICDEAFNLTLNEAREYFRREESTIVEGYCNSHFYFQISEYYAAWKLRGDDPTCYINGYYEEKDDLLEWNRYSIDRDNLEDYKIRHNPECAYLYYLYHYNGHVKQEGAKIIEVTSTPQFVKCVKEIQHHMRYWLAGLGIGIEANPSSNYMIGIFERYDKHPITKFYNCDLAISEKELKECPQIPVCINTDDQGIFSTYLDNEYALLALALEKSKDENGKDKYNRSRIYQWIDNLREIGINLSFAEQRQRSYLEMKDYEVENISML